jgi:hypothetical protein
MADIRDLISQASKSKIAQAAQGFVRGAQQNFQGAAQFAQQGAGRVQQSFRENPSQFFIGSPTALNRAQFSGNFLKQQTTNPILRGGIAAGQELIKGQQQGTSNIMTGIQQRNPLKAGLGAFQIATPGIAASFGGGQGLLAGGLGAGINAGMAKFQGQDVAEAAGRGFTQGFKTRAITGFTDPITSKVVGALAPAAGAATSFGQKALSQVAQRVVGGSANVLEDEAINITSGITTGNKDRVASLVLGALVSGNDAAVDALKGQLQRLRLPKAQVGEIVDKARSRLKESQFVDKAPTPDKPYGGLQLKAESRLPETTTNVFGQEIPAPATGQAGGIQLGPKPQLEKSKGQFLSSKQIIQEASKTNSPELVTTKVAELPQQKQRKFIQTIINSDSASPKLKEAAAKVDPQNYTVATNPQAIAFSQDYIKKNGADSAFEYIKNAKSTDQNTTTIGLDLVKQYQQQGNFDKAIEVIETLDQQARAAGRTIQALSLWNKLSPEGMLRFTKKAFDQANEQLRFKKLEMSDDLQSFITTRMNEIQKMPDGPEKTQATKEVLDRISKDIPPGIMDLIDSYRYQNMLSGPQTQLRNIYGNFFQGGVLRPATIPFEVGVDYVKSSLTGADRTRYMSEVPAYVRNFYGSIPAASQAFWQSMKGSELDTTRMDLNNLKQQNLPKALTVVPRFMQGMDNFFSTMISQAEYARLKKIGVTDSNAEAQARAMAEKLLFRGQLDPTNKEGQGALLSGIDTAVSWIQDGGKKFPPMRWFIPFVSTPTNALKQLIEYTPGVGLANLPKNDKKADLLAKQALASTISLFGASLAFQGQTTWAAPTDTKEKELFYASGRKPYSIKMGDKWVPMSYFGPLAGAFALPAAANYYQNESKTALTDTQIEKLRSILTSNIEFISQQSFLSNLGTVVNLARGDVDASVEGTLGFTAGQLIPAQGFIRYINKAIDPVYRKASGFKETIMKDIPGISQQLEAYTLPDGSISTRDPINMALPFDLGKERTEYDLPLEERREYNKQKNILKFAEKQLETGMSSTKTDGSMIKTPEGMSTTQTKDFIREKVKAGMDVSVEELNTAYLQKALTMPANNRYEESQKNSELFSSLSDVENNEYLTSEQKDILKNKIATETGLTRQDLDTYQIAKNDNNAKTLHVLDKRDQLQSNQEFIQYLVNGRRPINGKSLVSDGVIDNLVKDGILPPDVGKELKKLDLNQDGSIKKSISKIKSKKGKRAKVIKVKSRLRGVRLPKLKISRPKSRSSKSLTLTG